MRGAQGRHNPMAAIAAILVFFPTVSLAQTPIWTSDWTVPGALPLQYPASKSGFAFAANGDFVVGAASANYQDYQFIRMASSGAVLWAANVGSDYSSWDELTAVLPSTDGTTFVSIGTSLIKLDATGHPAWRRKLPASFLRISNAGALIAAGCNTGTSSGVVAALDAQTGAVAWENFYPTACPAGLVEDAAGNFFVSFNWGAGSSLARIDSAGHEAWSQAAQADDYSNLIGVGAGQVYARGNGGVRALHANDGSPAWNIPYPFGIAAAVLPNAAAGPVVLSGQSLDALAVQDGSVQWTTPFGNADSLHMLNGALVASSSYAVTRFDAATGQQLWSTPLVNDAYGNFVTALAIGALNGSTLLSIGNPYSAGAHGPVLQPLDFGNGNLLDPIPTPVAWQGVIGMSSVVDGTHVVDASASLGPVSSEIHLRRLSASDGSLDWETSDDPFFVQGGSPGNDQIFTNVAVGSGSVALAVAKSSNAFSQYTTGVAWAALYDAATGAKRWGISLQDPFQRYTTVGNPLVMGNGDVVVAVGAPIVSCNGCYPDVSTEQLSVFRLSAADGHVIWRRDARSLFAASYTDLVFPPAIIAVGDDIVAAGTFETSPAAATLVRFDGSTGATAWNSSVLAGHEPYAIFPDGGNLLVLGYDGWAKVDPGSGNTLWTGLAAPDCTVGVFCYVYSSAVLPGGDLLGVGESNYAPLITRRRGDGSGIEDYFQPESTVSNFRSVLIDLAVDGGGTPWVRLSREFRLVDAGINWLTQLDPATGNFAGGQQAIGFWSGDPILASHHSILNGTPTGNQLQVLTYATHPPAPGTWGDALLDTTVTATGDISVQVTTSASKTMPGRALTFHFLAAYSGDAPLSGARLFGFLPWGGTVANLSCAGQGVSNCVVDTRSGNVFATFDIASGGQADITGTVTVLPWPDTPAPVSAMAAGPTGLREFDTLNNFAAQAVAQSVFFNGFEGN